MNKEVVDALSMLYHCAKKDKEYTTQKQQFDFVYKYIEDLQHQLEEKDKIINDGTELIREKTKVIPFDEIGEGGGLELCDYDITKLLEILERGKNGKKVN